MYITLKENESMQDLVDRLMESSSLVYGIAPVAYWYENLHENGRIKDIHFSNHMREKLGYKSVEDFPDELSAFVTFLHPDDVQMMLDNAIAAGTGKTDKYDLQYRIRRADGEYIWCHATGELVKDFNGTTVGMYGAFIDITEQVELREKALAEQKSELQVEMHLREALAEQMTRIMELTDDIQAIYDVDYDTGAYSVYSYDNDYAESIIDSAEGLSFYADAAEDIRNIVYSEDRELAERTFNREYIKKTLDEQGEFAIEDRLVIDGEPVWHRVKFAKNRERTVIFSWVFSMLMSVLKPTGRIWISSTVWLRHITRYTTSILIRVNTHRVWYPRRPASCTTIIRNLPISKRWHPVI